MISWGTVQTWFDQGDVIVGRVDLATSDWEHFLPPRASRRVYGGPPDAQRRSRRTEGALRWALGALLGLRPEVVPIERTPRGKPYLAAGPGFSVAHTGDVALLALARRKQVGVDLEPAARTIDAEALAHGFFPERARNEILAAPPAERHHIALATFTCFEAVAKATGVGLTVPADDLERAGAGLCWRHVDVGSDHIACVAASPPLETIRIFAAPRPLR